MKKLVLASRALAELNGLSQKIPNENILINSLSLQEAKDSSGIENIITTHDELYKSQVDNSFISKQAKEVENYREALILGFVKVKKTGLILNSDILEIQETLENNNAGFRTQIGTTLKNDLTGEIVYTPPQEHEEILKLMDNLEKYINDNDLEDLDSILKMIIIHFQFESIHPFYDGNGRTGRIINILYLVKENLLNMPILYLSNYIINHKNDYYRLFQEVRINDNWEDWILYMLEAIEKTSLDTMEMIQKIWKLMGETKKSLKENLPNIYSKDLLEIIFSHPYTKIDFLSEGLGIHRETAGKYLNLLVENGYMEMVKKGSSKYFINKELYKLLKEGL